MTIPSLTRSIVALHCLSFAFSLSILVLSASDCGILSLCLNPIFSTLTMIFHVVVLLVAYRRPKTDPALPLAFTLVTILLVLGWVCAYAVTCAFLCQHQTQVQVFEAVVDVPQTMKASQKLQVMLDPFVCVILADLAYKSHKRRRALLQCNGDFDDVESDCWSRNTDSDASSIQSEQIP